MYVLSNAMRDTICLHNVASLVDIYLSEKSKTLCADKLVATPCQYYQAEEFHH